MPSLWEALLWGAVGGAAWTVVFWFAQWLAGRRNRSAKRNLYRKSENPPALETPHRVRTAQSAAAKPVRMSKARFKARRRFR